MSQNLFEPRRPVKDAAPPPETYRPTPPGQEPTWARIYWNTLRAFLRRRFGMGSIAPRPHQDGPGRSRRPLVLAIVVAGVALGTVAVLLAVTRSDGNSTAGQNSSAEVPGEPSGGASPAVREELARWAREHIGTGQVIACDTAVCGSLTAAGFPDSSLVRVKESADELQSADVVVLTTTLRTRLGTAVDQVTAPRPFAVFGGAAGGGLFAVAHEGRPAYAARAGAELAERRDAGAALLANESLTFSGPARALLRAGLVDMRVCALLAALGGEHTLGISSFGDAAPGAADAVARAGLEIETVDSVGAAGDAGPATDLRALIAAQRPPYLPLDTVVRPSEGGRSAVLTVRYSQPAALDPAVAEPDRASQDDQAAHTS
ncbi:hypothetical protein [Streptomyces niveus]|uniref:hypothetical protein n=1 Tax=Streptomyces niveus TaxID=193462 RepID=UPI0036D3BB7B